MTSAPAANVTRTARRASDSPAAHFLARAGLAARGVIYILVGVVAVLVALGQSSREADQSATSSPTTSRPSADRTARHTIVWSTANHVDRCARLQPQPARAVHL